MESFSEKALLKIQNSDFLEEISSKIWTVLDISKVESWVASEVYRIQTEKDQYYFKSVSRWVYRDIVAFAEREKNGILLPEIICFFRPWEEVARYLMKSIDGKTLDHWDIKDPQSFHISLWKTLYQMHSTSFDGYYDFEEWASEIIWTTVDYIDMFESKYPIHKLRPVAEKMNISRNVFEDSRKVVLEYSEWKKSVFCHNDLYTHNIFSEKDIIVIDPNVDLDMWIMDLGRTMYYTLFRRYYKNVFDLIEWYWVKLSNEVLLAIVLIRWLKVLCGSIDDDQKIRKFKERYIRFQNELEKQ